jgi:VWFA-related protein
MLHTRLARRVYACVALVCAASVAQAAERPTFTAGTRIVTLPSTVTDGENRIVLNLTKNDFEVLEDNRQQPVTFFDTTILPIRVVVLLDTSASMAGTVRLLRTAAREFVTRLLPGDACRVGAFNDSVQFGGAFTSDRNRLAQDIDSLEVGDATRLYDALAAGLDTLEGGADRRVILVLTDGADTESRTGLRSVIGRARADGVMVYAIGIERTRFNGTRPVVSAPDRGLKKRRATPVALPRAGGRPTPHILLMTTRLMSSRGLVKASTSVLMASKISEAVWCLTSLSFCSRHSG